MSLIPIENQVELIQRQAIQAKLERDWMDHLRAADRSPDTRAKYRDALRHFWRWCHAQQPEIFLGDVTRADVCAWRDDQAGRFSVSTIKQRLAAIRGFYDWLVEHHLVERNPAERVRCQVGSGAALQRDELTDDEMRALLDSCVARDDMRVALRDRAILYLMAYCALRTIEVARATREDLRERDGRVVLWVQGKGHRQPDEFVVLPAAAEAALREWLAVHPKAAKGPLFVSLSRRGKGPLTPNYIRRMVKRRLRMCGIDSPSKSTHSLRHSAITRARRGGASLEDIQAMARHRNVNTTRRYLHGARRTKRPAEDRITYGDESPADTGKQK